MKIWRIKKFQAISIGVILLAASVGMGFQVYLKQSSHLDFSPALQTLYVREAKKLEAVFSDLDYNWPLEKTGVPAVSIKQVPKQMRALPVDEKKASFFRMLLPLALAENKRIEMERAYLLQLLSSDDNDVKLADLKQLAKKYKVKGDVLDTSVQQRLLRRIDTVPVALVLAQAANESGWGTSRFALEGNSLFGEWTYKNNAGLKPKKSGDKKHAVRAFDSIHDSVRSYVMNLNVGHAYKDLRLMRAQARKDGRQISAMELAAGLRRYSERGDAYVSEIRSIIQRNQLQALRETHLADVRY